MRILVDENIPQGDIAFAPYGTVERFAGRGLNRDAILRGAPCEALIVRSITKVNAHLLAGTPVRFVGTATIGTDHVDRAWLAEQGLGFASAPGCNANSVAEYVVAALLELQAEKGLPLDGAVLGIVGYGQVGRQLRLKAEALGLRVLLCDPPLQEQGIREDFHPLPFLLRNCDILSLHVPLTRSGPHATLGLIHCGSLLEIGRPLTLLNTCRGEVTDEKALLQGKAQGVFRHLVLDVFPGEPSPNPELWSQCDLITPHIAGYSLQGKLGGTQQVLEAFCRFFQKGKAEKRREPSPARPGIHWDSTRPFSPSPWPWIRGAVRQAYAIQGDDHALRQALGDVEPALGFDRLRRDYPIRHEFSRYFLPAPESVPAEAYAILRKLGFRDV